MVMSKVTLWAQVPIFATHADRNLAPDPPAGTAAIQIGAVTHIRRRKAPNQGTRSGSRTSTWTDAARVGQPAPRSMEQWRLELICGIGG